MKALEPGMRVYVGWTNKSCDKTKNEICQQGTLKSGPFSTSKRTIGPFWFVDLDSGAFAEVNESIIFPIDDDDEQDIIEHKELETTK